MGFIKVIKNRSYFSRFQVKYRRRREGKTDYYARRKLVTQDKTKYNARKYRLVVRFTNKDIVAQIVSAHITGDRILSAAYAHELTKYGLPVGHTNYAAAYAVGLLLARRVLTKLHLAHKYPGALEVTGEEFNVEPIDNGPRPFRVFLDTGLKITSTGSKVFATLKGATDGGLYVPHSVNRFVGWNSEEKKLHADVLRSHIFGGHVSAYMKSLKEEDEASYTARFSQYIKNGITADTLEEVITKVHAAIRRHSIRDKKEVKKVVHKRYNARKLTLKQRKARVALKKKQLKASQAGEPKEEVAAGEEED